MRAILHCDLNNFYASCEVLQNPSLKGLPVAVGGREEDRHGVVVASNYEAKKFGVRCGVTTHEAKKRCPSLVICPPHFSLYNKYSRLVRRIYESYTDKVEVFSIDECFLDVTHSKIFGSPLKIANEIRERVKNEIGLTISVGVSYNKLSPKSAVITKSQTRPLLSRKKILKTSFGVFLLAICLAWAERVEKNSKDLE